MATSGGFLLALLALYVLAGLGCALLLGGRRRAADRLLVDVVLLLTLWPLYAPFLLAADASLEAPGGDREAALLRALRQVQGTPLSRLLPDRATVRALGRALRAAAERIRAIDAVLARPEMSEAEAVRGLAAFQEPPGATEARAAMVVRLQGIRHLKATREHLGRRLAEVDALLAQLLTQVEVLRLGGAGDAPGGELVAELLARVEAVGEMLEDGGPGPAAQAVP